MAEYKQALDQYQAILDKQANAGSQVPWFQIAGAFLDPGRTGSFGESLGKAASTFGRYQDEQQKNQIPLAKARLDLMQAKYGLANQAQAQQDFTSLIGGQPGAAVAGAAPTASSNAVPSSHVEPASMNAAAASTPSAVTLVGATAHPADTASPRTLTIQDALKYAVAHPEDKERITLLTEAAKVSQPDYLIAQNGVVFNKKTGQYVTDQPIPGQEQKTYTTPFGDFKLTSTDYDQFRKLPSQDQQLKFLQGISGTNEQGMPRTVQDVETATAGRKETSTRQASADVTGAQTLLSNRKAAEAMLPVYDRIQTILGQPGVKENLGIFKRGDVADAVSSFLSGDHSEKSVRNMQDTLRRANASENVINAINDIDGQRGVAEAEYIKNMGSTARVTDFRLKFAQGLHPSSQDDMYGAFQNKLNEFKNRANWDVEQHNLYDKLNRDRGVTYSQLNTQPEFTEAYNRHSAAYASGMPTNTPVPTGTTPSAPAGSWKQRLNAEKARRAQLGATQ
jgi:hypothetical protein